MRGVLSSDLYEPTMATSYLRRGMTGPATFSLFVRRLPTQRGFLVSAGLAACPDYLESFQFTTDEVSYVGELLGLTAADQRRFR
jgi:nicotinate phosphoribosyltransferase